MMKVYAAVQVQLYTPAENSLWHLLNRRNGRPHNNSGCLGENKNPSLQGIKL
jgi:hypothetical protein